MNKHGVTNTQHHSAKKRRPSAEVAAEQHARHSSHRHRNARQEQSGQERVLNEPVDANVQHLPFSMACIPGFYCVFVFDEPDVLLGDVPPAIKQRVLETSSLIPIIDNAITEKILQSPLFPHSDEEQNNNQQQPLHKSSNTIHSSHPIQQPLKKTIIPPRGFISTEEGESARHYKERVISMCVQSPQFRRFWRRHTHCPIPLDANGVPDMTNIMQRAQKASYAIAKLIQHTEDRRSYEKEEKRIMRKEKQKQKEQQIQSDVNTQSKSEQQSASVYPQNTAKYVGSPKHITADHLTPVPPPSLLMKNNESSLSPNKKNLQLNDYDNIRRGRGRGKEEEQLRNSSSQSLESMSSFTSKDDINSENDSFDSSSEQQSPNKPLDYSQIGIDNQINKIDDTDESSTSSSYTDSSPTSHSLKSNSTSLLSTNKTNQSQDASYDIKSNKHKKKHKKKHNKQYEQQIKSLHLPVLSVPHPEEPPLFDVWMPPQPQSSQSNQSSQKIIETKKNIENQNNQQQDQQKPDQLKGIQGKEQQQQQQLKQQSKLQTSSYSDNRSSQRDMHHPPRAQHNGRETRETLQLVPDDFTLLLFRYTPAPVGHSQKTIQDRKALINKAEVDLQREEENKWIRAVGSEDHISKRIERQLRINSDDCQTQSSMEKDVENGKKEILNSTETVIIHSDMEKDEENKNLNSSLKKSEAETKQNKNKNIQPTIQSKLNDAAHKLLSVHTCFYDNHTVDLDSVEHNCFDAQTIVGQHRPFDPYSQQVCPLPSALALYFPGQFPLPRAEEHSIPRSYREITRDRRAIADVAYVVARLSEMEKQNGKQIIKEENDEGCISPENTQSSYVTLPINYQSDSLAQIRPQQPLVTPWPLNIVDLGDFCHVHDLQEPPEANNSTFVHQSCLNNTNLYGFFTANAERSVVNVLRLEREKRKQLELERKVMEQEKQREREKQIAIEREKEIQRYNDNIISQQGYGQNDSNIRLQQGDAGIRGRTAHQGQGLYDKHHQFFEGAVASVKQKHNQRKDGNRIDEGDGDESQIDTSSRSRSPADLQGLNQQQQQQTRPMSIKSQKSQNIIQSPLRNSQKIREKINTNNQNKDELILSEDDYAFVDSVMDKMKQSDKNSDYDDRYSIGLSADQCWERIIRIRQRLARIADANDRNRIQQFSLNNNNNNRLSDSLYTSALFVDQSNNWKESQNKADVQLQLLSPYQKQIKEEELERELLIDVQDADSDPNSSSILNTTSNISTSLKILNQSVASSEQNIEGNENQKGQIKGQEKHGILEAINEEEFDEIFGCGYEGLKGLGLYGQKDKGITQRNNQTQQEKKINESQKDMKSKGNEQQQSNEQNINNWWDPHTNWNTTPKFIAAFCVPGKVHVYRNIDNITNMKIDDSNERSNDKLIGKKLEIIRDKLMDGGTSESSSVSTFSQNFQPMKQSQSQQQTSSSSLVLVMTQGRRILGQCICPLDMQLRTVLRSLAIFTRPSTKTPPAPVSLPQQSDQISKSKRGSSNRRSRGSIGSIDDDESRIDDDDEQDDINAVVGDVSDLNGRIVGFDCFGRIAEMIANYTETPVEKAYQPKGKRVRWGNPGEPGLEGNDDEEDEEGETIARLRALEQEQDSSNDSDSAVARRRRIRGKIELKKKERIRKEQEKIELEEEQKRQEQLKAEINRIKSKNKIKNGSKQMNKDINKNILDDESSSSDGDDDKQKKKQKQQRQKAIDDINSDDTGESEESSESSGNEEEVARKLDALTKESNSDEREKEVDKKNEEQDDILFQQINAMLTELVGQDMIDEAQQSFNNDDYEEILREAVGATEEAGLDEDNDQDLDDSNVDMQTGIYNQGEVPSKTRRLNYLLLQRRKMEERRLIRHKRQLLRNQREQERIKTINNLKNKTKKSKKNEKRKSMHKDKKEKPTDDKKYLMNKKLQLQRKNKSSDKQISIKNEDKGNEEEKKEKAPLLCDIWCPEPEIAPINVLPPSPSQQQLSLVQQQPKELKTSQKNFDLNQSHSQKSLFNPSMYNFPMQSGSLSTYSMQPTISSQIVPGTTSARTLLPISSPLTTLERTRFARMLLSAIEERSGDAAPYSIHTSSSHRGEYGRAVRKMVKGLARDNRLNRIAIKIRQRLLRRDDAKFRRNQKKKNKLLAQLDRKEKLELERLVQTQASAEQIELQNKQHEKEKEHIRRAISKAYRRNSNIASASMHLPNPRVTATMLTPSAVAPTFSQQSSLLLQQQTSPSITFSPNTSLINIDAEQTILQSRASPSIEQTAQEVRANSQRVQSFTSGQESIIQLKKQQRQMIRYVRMQSLHKAHAQRRAIIRRMMVKLPQWVLYNMWREYTGEAESARLVYQKELNEVGNMNQLIIQSEWEKILEKGREDQRMNIWEQMREEAEKWKSEKDKNKERAKSNSKNNSLKMSANDPLAQIKRYHWKLMENYTQLLAIPQLFLDCTRLNIASVNQQGHLLHPTAFDLLDEIPQSLHLHQHQLEEEKLQKQNQTNAKKVFNNQLEPIQSSGHDSSDWECEWREEDSITEDQQKDEEEPELVWERMRSKWDETGFFINEFSSESEAEVAADEDAKGYEVIQEGRTDRISLKQNKSNPEGKESAQNNDKNIVKSKQQTQQSTKTSKVLVKRQKDRLLRILRPNKANPRDRWYTHSDNESYSEGEWNGRGYDPDNDIGWTWGVTHDKHKLRQRRLALIRRVLHRHAHAILNSGLFGQKSINDTKANAAQFLERALTALFNNNNASKILEPLASIAPNADKCVTSSIRRRMAAAVEHYEDAWDDLCAQEHSTALLTPHSYFTERIKEKAIITDLAVRQKRNNARIEQRKLAEQRRQERRIEHEKQKELRRIEMEKAQHQFETINNQAAILYQKHDSQIVQQGVKQPTQSIQITSSPLISLNTQSNQLPQSLSAQSSQSALLQTKNIVLPPGTVLAQHPSAPAPRPFTRRITKEEMQNQFKQPVDAPAPRPFTKRITPEEMRLQFKQMKEMDIQQEEGMEDQTQEQTSFQQTNLTDSISDSPEMISFNTINTINRPTRAGRGRGLLKAPYFQQTSSPQARSPSPSNKSQQSNASQQLNKQQITSQSQLPSPQSLFVTNSPHIPPTSDTTISKQQINAPIIIQPTKQTAQSPLQVQAQLSLPLIQSQPLQQTNSILARPNSLHGAPPLPPPSLPLSINENNTTSNQTNESQMIKDENVREKEINQLATHQFTIIVDEIYSNSSGISNQNSTQSSSNEIGLSDKKNDNSENDKWQTTKIFNITSVDASNYCELANSLPISPNIKQQLLDSQKDQQKTPQSQISSTNQSLPIQLLPTTPSYCGLPPRIIHPFLPPPAPLVPCNHGCKLVGFLESWQLRFQVIYHNSHHRYLPIPNRPPPKEAVLDALRRRGRLVIKKTQHKMRFRNRVPFNKPLINPVANKVVGRVKVIKDEQQGNLMIKDLGSNNLNKEINELNTQPQPLSPIFLQENKDNNQQLPDSNKKCDYTIERREVDEVQFDLNGDEGEWIEDDIAKRIDMGVGFGEGLNMKEQLEKDIEERINERKEQDDQKEMKKNIEQGIESDKSLAYNINQGQSKLLLNKQNECDSECKNDSSEEFEQRILDDETVKLVELAPILTRNMRQRARAIEEATWEKQAEQALEMALNTAESQEIQNMMQKFGDNQNLKEGISEMIIKGKSNEIQTISKPEIGQPNINQEDNISHAIIPQNTNIGKSLQSKATAIIRRAKQIKSSNFIHPISQRTRLRISRTLFRCTSQSARAALFASTLLDPRQPTFRFGMHPTPTSLVPLHKPSPARAQAALQQPEKIQDITRVFVAVMKQMIFAHYDPIQEKFGLNFSLDMVDAILRLAQKHYTDKHRRGMLDKICIEYGEGFRDGRMVTYISAGKGEGPSDIASRKAKDNKERERKRKIRKEMNIKQKNRRDPDTDTLMKQEDDPSRLAKQKEDEIRNILDEFDEKPDNGLESGLTDIDEEDSYINEEDIFNENDENINIELIKQDNQNQIQNYGEDTVYKATVREQISVFSPKAKLNINQWQQLTPVGQTNPSKSKNSKKEKQSMSDQISTKQLQNNEQLKIPKTSTIQDQDIYNGYWDTETPQNQQQNQQQIEANNKVVNTTDDGQPFNQYNDSLSQKRAVQQAFNVSQKHATIQQTKNTSNKHSRSGSASSESDLTKKQTSLKVQQRIQGNEQQDHTYKYPNDSVKFMSQVSLSPLLQSIPHSRNDSSPSRSSLGSQSSHLQNKEEFRDNKRRIHSRSTPREQFPFSNEKSERRLAREQQKAELKAKILQLKEKERQQRTFVKKVARKRHIEEAKGIADDTPDYGVNGEAANMQGLLCVGDIHGSLNSLRAALDIADKMLSCVDDKDKGDDDEDKLDDAKNRNTKKHNKGNNDDSSDTSSDSKNYDELLSDSSSSDDDSQKIEKLKKQAEKRNKEKYGPQREEKKKKHKRDKDSVRRAVVFLGDYVDRGKNSLEVIVMLMLYRLCYPRNVFLVRGNHESYRSFDWGFNDELMNKFPIDEHPSLQQQHQAYQQQVLNLIQTMANENSSRPTGRLTINNGMVYDMNGNLIEQIKIPHPLYLRFLELFNNMPLGILVTLRYHPPLPTIPHFQTLNGTKINLYNNALKSELGLEKDFIMNNNNRGKKDEGNQSQSIHSPECQQFNQYIQQCEQYEQKLQNSKDASPPQDKLKTVDTNQQNQQLEAEIPLLEQSDTQSQDFLQTQKLSATQTPEISYKSIDDEKSDQQNIKESSSMQNISEGSQNAQAQDKQLKMLKTRSYMDNAPQAQYITSPPNTPQQPQKPHQSSPMINQAKLLYPYQPQEHEFSPDRTPTPVYINVIPQNEKQKNQARSPLIGRTQIQNQNQIISQFQPQKSALITSSSAHLKQIQQNMHAIHSYPHRTTFINICRACGTAHIHQRETPIFGFKTSGTDIVGNLEQTQTQQETIQDKSNNILTKSVDVFTPSTQEENKLNIQEQTQTQHPHLNHSMSLPLINYDASGQGDNQMSGFTGRLKRTQPVIIRLLSDAFSSLLIAEPANYAAAEFYPYPTQLKLGQTNPVSQSSISQTTQRISVKMPLGASQSTSLTPQHDSTQEVQCPVCHASTAQLFNTKSNFVRNLSTHVQFFITQPQQKEELLRKVSTIPLYSQSQIDRDDSMPPPSQSRSVHSTPQKQRSQQSSSYSQTNQKTQSYLLPVDSQLTRGGAGFICLCTQCLQKLAQHVQPEQQRNEGAQVVGGLQRRGTTNWERFERRVAKFQKHDRQRRKRIKRDEKMAKKEKNGELTKEKEKLVQNSKPTTLNSIQPPQGVKRVRQRIEELEQKLKEQNEKEQGWKKFKTSKELIRTDTISSTTTTNSSEETSSPVDKMYICESTNPEDVDNENDIGDIDQDSISDISDYNSCIDYNLTRRKSEIDDVFNTGVDKSFGKLGNYVINNDKQNSRKKMRYSYDDEQSDLFPNSQKNIKQNVSSQSKTTSLVKGTVDQKVINNNPHQTSPIFSSIGRKNENEKPLIRERKVRFISSSGYDDKSSESSEPIEVNIPVRRKRDSNVNKQRRKERKMKKETDKQDDEDDDEQISTTEDDQHQDSCSAPELTPHMLPTRTHTQHYLALHTISPKFMTVSQKQEFEAAGALPQRGFQLPSLYSQTNTNIQQQRGRKENKERQQEQSKEKLKSQVIPPTPAFIVSGLQLLHNLFSIYTTPSIMYSGNTQQISSLLSPTRQPIDIQPQKKKRQSISCPPRQTRVAHCCFVCGKGSIHGQLPQKHDKNIDKLKEGQIQNSQQYIIPFGHLNAQIPMNSLATGKQATLQQSPQSQQNSSQLKQNIILKEGQTVLQEAVKQKQKQNLTITNPLKNQGIFVSPFMQTGSLLSPSLIRSKQSDFSQSQTSLTGTGQPTDSQQQDSDAQQPQANINEYSQYLLPLIDNMTIPQLPNPPPPLPQPPLIDPPIPTLPQAPMVETRRILLCHGGMASLVPTLFVERELSQLQRFDYFRQCEDPMQKEFNFGHPRSREQDIQHTTLWADPGDVDLPNGNRCPYSLDTCRRFMAANRIDMVIRAHQFFPRGFMTTHENRVTTVFSSFDYCGHNEASVLLIKLTPPMQTAAPSQTSAMKHFQSVSFFPNSSLSSSSSYGPFIGVTQAISVPGVHALKRAAQLVLEYDLARREEGVSQHKHDREVKSNQLYRKLRYKLRIKRENETQLEKRMQNRQHAMQKRLEQNIAAVGERMNLGGSTVGSRMTVSTIKSGKSQLNRKQSAETRQQLIIEQGNVQGPVQETLQVKSKLGRRLIDKSKHLSSPSLSHKNIPNSPPNSQLIQQYGISGQIGYASPLAITFGSGSLAVSSESGQQGQKISISPPLSPSSQHNTVFTGHILFDSPPPPYHQILASRKLTSPMLLSPTVSPKPNNQSNIPVNLLQQQQNVGNVNSQRFQPPFQNLNTPYSPTSPILASPPPLSDQYLSLSVIQQMPPVNYAQSLYSAFSSSFGEDSRSFTSESFGDVENYQDNIEVNENMKNKENSSGESLQKLNLTSSSALIPTQLRGTQVQDPNEQSKQTEQDSLNVNNSQSPQLIITPPQTQKPALGSNLSTDSSPPTIIVDGGRAQMQQDSPSQTKDTDHRQRIQIQKLIDKGKIRHPGSPQYRPQLATSEVQQFEKNHNQLLAIVGKWTDQVVIRWAQVDKWNANLKYYLINQMARYPLRFQIQALPPLVRNLLVPLDSSSSQILPSLNVYNGRDNIHPLCVLDCVNRPSALSLSLIGLHELAEVQPMGIILARLHDSQIQYGKQKQKSIKPLHDSKSTISGTDQKVIFQQHQKPTMVRQGSNISEKQKLQSTVQSNIGTPPLIMQSPGSLNFASIYSPVFSQQGWSMLPNTPSSLKPLFNAVQTSHFSPQIYPLSPKNPKSNIFSSFATIMPHVQQQQQQYHAQSPVGEQSLPLQSILHKQKHNQLLAQGNASQQEFTKQETNIAQNIRKKSSSQVVLDHNYLDINQANIHNAQSSKSLLQNSTSPSDENVQQQIQTGQSNQDGSLLNQNQLNEQHSLQHQSFPTNQYSIHPIAFSTQTQDTSIQYSIPTSSNSPSVSPSISSDTSHTQSQSTQSAQFIQYAPLVPCTCPPPCNCGCACGCGAISGLAANNSASMQGVDIRGRGNHELIHKSGCIHGQETTPMAALLTVDVLQYGPLCQMETVLAEQRQKKAESDENMRQELEEEEFGDVSSDKEDVYPMKKGQINRYYLGKKRHVKDNTLKNEEKIQQIIEMRTERRKNTLSNACNKERTEGVDVERRILRTERVRQQRMERERELRHRESGRILDILLNMRACSIEEAEQKLSHRKEKRKIKKQKSLISLQEGSTSVISDAQNGFMKKLENQQEEESRNEMHLHHAQERLTGAYGVAWVAELNERLGEVCQRILRDEKIIRQLQIVRQRSNNSQSGQIVPEQKSKLYPNTKAQNTLSFTSLQLDRLKEIGDIENIDDIDLGLGEMSSSELEEDEFDDDESEDESSDESYSYNENPQSMMSTSTFTDDHSSYISHQSKSGKLKSVNKYQQSDIRSQRSGSTGYETGSQDSDKMIHDIDEDLEDGAEYNNDQGKK
ncbi:MAG: hypothetical protein EZS28_001766 [Streblomastix strix]|uniref:Serine/threonine-protein phosphatase n=1 Tax=Streblomastix strix TaxID=222440 RepID=A0A5J4X7K2_9EUKA|nr:MAG: hypothetical protein EZS28_001766 [Streblomastix strix]